MHSLGLALLTEISQSRRGKEVPNIYAKLNITRVGSVEDDPRIFE